MLTSLNVSEKLFSEATSACSEISSVSSITSDCSVSTKTTKLSETPIVTMEHHSNKCTNYVKRPRIDLDERDPSFQPYPFSSTRRLNDKRRRRVYSNIGQRYCDSRYVCDDQDTIHSSRPYRQQYAYHRTCYDEMSQSYYDPSETHYGSPETHVKQLHRDSSRSHRRGRKNSISVSRHKGNGYAQRSYYDAFQGPVSDGRRHRQSSGSYYRHRSHERHHRKTSTHDDYFRLPRSTTDRVSSKLTYFPPPGPGRRIERYPCSNSTDLHRDSRRSFYPVPHRASGVPNIRYSIRRDRAYNYNVSRNSRTGPPMKIGIERRSRRVNDFRDDLDRGLEPHCKSYKQSPQRYYKDGKHINLCPPSEKWLSQESRLAINSGRQVKHSTSRVRRNPIPHGNEEVTSSTRGGESSVKANDADEIIHFQWRPGQVIGGRYTVISQLGEGTFGRVLACMDTDTNREVALKLVRDVPRYTSAAITEAEILEEIRKADPGHKSNCVLMLERFLYDSRRQIRAARPIENAYFGGRAREISDKTEKDFGPGIHMCLVSEKLGPSLFSVLSMNDFKGFFLSDIQMISKECLRALAFLREIRLTHTDLKPENILLYSNRMTKETLPRSCYRPRYWDGDASSSRSGSVSSDRNKNEQSICDPYHYPKKRTAPVVIKRPRDCRVRLIDFGGATFHDDDHCSLINTRQYRAPEVILQTGWSYPSDMWSLGCVLIELYTGTLLFRTHEHLEHLAMMEKIISPIPKSLLQSANRTPSAKYITSTPHGPALKWPGSTASRRSIAKVSKCKRLHDLVLPKHAVFADFIASLLCIDPAARPTPLEALRHPFILESNISE